VVVVVVDLVEAVAQGVIALPLEQVVAAHLLKLP
jgi:hypothetical protein